MNNLRYPTKKNADTPGRAHRQVSRRYSSLEVDIDSDEVAPADDVAIFQRRVGRRLVGEVGDAAAYRHVVGHRILRRDAVLVIGRYLRERRVRIGRRAGVERLRQEEQL